MSRCHDNAMSHMSRCHDSAMTRHPAVTSQPWLAERFQAEPAYCPSPWPHLPAAHGRCESDLCLLLRVGPRALFSGRERSPPSFKAPLCAGPHSPTIATQRGACCYALEGLAIGQSTRWGRSASAGCGSYVGNRQGQLQNLRDRWQEGSGGSSGNRQIYGSCCKRTRRLRTLHAPQQLVPRVHAPHGHYRRWYPPLLGQRTTALHGCMQRLRVAARVLPSGEGWPRRTCIVSGVAR
jgi:hypothetical protein